MGVMRSQGKGLSLFSVLDFRSGARGDWPLRPAPVEINGRADQISECTLLYVSTLENIDRSPSVAFKSRVEELVRIGEVRPVRKGKLHFIFEDSRDRDDSIA